MLGCWTTPLLAVTVVSGKQSGFTENVFWAGWAFN